MLVAIDILLTVRTGMPLTQTENSSLGKTEASEVKPQCGIDTTMVKISESKTSAVIYVYDVYVYMYVYMFMYTLTLSSISLSEFPWWTYIIPAVSNNIVHNFLQSQTLLF